MERRILITIGLVCLLTTSGCLGLFGGSSGEAPATSDVTTSTATATTTVDDGSESQTATTTETPSQAYSAVKNHQQQLESTNGFTATLVQNRTEGDRSSNVEIRYRIDFADDRYLATVSGMLAGNSVQLTRFTVDDTTHERFVVGERERIRNASAPYEAKVKPVNVSRAMGGNSFAAQLGKIDLDEDGTETFQGQELDRYTASGPEAWDVPRPQGAGSIDEFEMTVLVDEQGVVRYVEYRITGKTDDGASFEEYYRLSITGIGAPPVEAPEWAQ